jgi:hypothetical protein
MPWHWSGVIRLIAIIVGVCVGILDKFVLGSGWIPAIGLTILVFLAIPFITGLVWEAVERLMAWREIKPHSGTLDGLAPRDTGRRPMTPPRRFPPPWRVVELPGGYAVENANGQWLCTFYGRAEPNVAQQAGDLTLDEARHLAANFARLPELLSAAEGTGRDLAP